MSIQKPRYTLFNVFVGFFVCFLERRTFENAMAEQITEGNGNQIIKSVNEITSLVKFSK